MRVASMVQFIATLFTVAALTQASATTEPSSTPAASTAPAASAQRLMPCANGPYREFDFWAGEWVVKDASGEEAGRNSVSIEQGGCVLIERWSGADGSSGRQVVVGHAEERDLPRGFVKQRVHGACIAIARLAHRARDAQPLAVRRHGHGHAGFGRKTHELGRMDVPTA